MNQLTEQKAKHIFTQFSKAPILEMVQYMVDQNVDAQVLNRIKLLDQTYHKNKHVISYGEKVSLMYERVCKILVTYPSLIFVDQQFRIKKNKERVFNRELITDKQLSEMELQTILDILNQAISMGIDACQWVAKPIQQLLKESVRFNNALALLLKLACDDGDNKHIQKMIEAWQN